MLEGGWEQYERNDTLRAIYEINAQLFGVFDLYGNRADRRWKLVALISNHFAKKGTTITATTLNELVDGKFGRDQFHWDRCCQSELLWLRLDYTRKHSWNESVFCELLSRRTQYLTIITSSNPLRHSLFEINLLDCSGVIQHEV
jgi:hypothetical protein